MNNSSRVFFFTVFLSISTIFLAPCVHAAEMGAGFAAKSIFFSHTPLTDGESVTIYASVVNTSESAFSGKVVFTDAQKEIGNLAVTFASGEARIVSISWTPTQGEHTIVATLKSANDVPVASSGQLTASVTVTTNVAVKPPEVVKKENEALVQPSVGVQKAIEYVSPPVAGALQPIFVALDHARVSAAGAVGEQIAKTKTALTSKDTAKSAASKKVGLSSSAWSIMLNVYAMFLSALMFCIANPIAFYPVVVLLIPWLLYKLYKSMTRSRYDRY